MSLPRPFALERFFARYEFNVPHVICASDVEGIDIGELMAMFDAETRALWSSLRLGYTESSGHPLLRREISLLYDAIALDDVVVFSGAEEGVNLIINALIEPGDHAIVISPAYQSLYELPRAAGAEVTLVPLNLTDWSLDVDALFAAATAKTKLVVLNFPHSPTGAMIVDRDLRRIADWCHDRQITLLSDEVYRFLEHGSAPLSPAADLSASAVSLGVMSKAFGLAGLRIGWMATRNVQLRDRVLMLKDYSTICNSAPSEVLAIGALRARARLLRRAHLLIESNLVVADAFFARQRERCEWVRPLAGSVGFPRFTQGSADGVVDRLARDYGVLILPGSVFDADPARFRLGLGRSDFADGLAKLERAIEHIWPA